MKARLLTLIKEFAENMAGIDFTKKGLNQMIFAKRAVKATAGRNSSAFKAILANKDISHVINKSGEKKVFYNALKKRGMASDSHGITKNVLKKVLGDIEHSGEFSHSEMTDLRKSLIGGSFSKSIIREHATTSAVEKSHNQQEAKIHEHINEIISRGHEKAKINSYVSSSSVVSRNSDTAHTGKYHNYEQKNSDIQENVLVKLGTSDNNIRKYENSSFSPSTRHFSENNSTAFGHVTGLKPSQYNHFGAKSIGIEEAKTRLASIQANEEEGDKD